MALVPVLLYEIYRQIGMADQRVCFTAHNLGHQGITGESILWATGLCNPGRFFVQERLRDDLNPAALNLIKEGIVYSNFVTTISPGHAWEVCNSDQARTWDIRCIPTGQKFGGVPNGGNYKACDPEVDWSIPKCYGPDSIDDKYVNRRALPDRFLLRDECRAIVAYVGRLDAQKGVHLIHHAIFCALAEGAQLVLFGQVQTRDHGTSDISSTTSMTIPTCAWSCSSAPSSQAWCMRGPIC
jgi:starch synthase